MLFNALTAILLLFATSVEMPKSSAAKFKNKLEISGIQGYFETWNYQKDKLNKKTQSESLLFISSNSIPDYTTVIFWFHGCGGYSKRTFNTRLLSQIQKLEAKNHSYALIVPEMLWSKNTKTPCGRQSRNFRKRGSLVEFVDDSIKRIERGFLLMGKQKPRSPRVVFIGHSAGGSVFKAAAKSGDLCDIKPDVVVWSDSTYGNWFKSAWKNCLNQGESNVVVLIRKWTATWKSFKKFKMPEKKPAWLEVKYYKGKIFHSTIGDNAIEYSEIFEDGC